MEVRSAIQQIAMEHRRRYGYRRITAEAAPPRMQINHKRVAQIMREDTAGRIPQSRVSALHASGSSLILI
jgi:hypothetical protein